MIQSLTKDVPQFVLPFVTIYIFKNHYSRGDRFSRLIRNLLAMTSFSFLLCFSIEVLIAENWMGHLSAKFFSLSFTIIYGVQAFSCHCRYIWYLTFATDVYFVTRQLSEPEFSTPSTPVILLELIRCVLLAWIAVRVEIRLGYDKAKRGGEEEAQGCEEGINDSGEETEYSEEQTQDTREETRLLDSTSEAPGG
ncbi:hypothetical protein BKA56DRAFT_193855 [Ilyonectria sp. MPI-CAGE-AT-0026]|nr:hypothetical protein BKA56DRAFT_193855 [Ilyonectria sp. MPI-CAGE-AT-0026]